MNKLMTYFALAVALIAEVFLCLYVRKTSLHGL